jgi:hypothetical protein
MGKGKKKQEVRKERKEYDMQEWENTVIQIFKKSKKEKSKKPSLL